MLGGTAMGYYDDHTLSVSSVRLFAQNPARALADWNNECPWFDDEKALLLGRAFHDGMENLLKITKANADTDSPDDLREQAYVQVEKELTDLIEIDSEYESLLSKKGAMLTDTKRMFTWLKSLWFSTATLQLFRVATSNNDELDLFIEKPFRSEYHGIAFKGKLDSFVVNHQAKIIDAYDYKTTRPFDPSGYEWGTDINGERRMMPVEWMVEKLFPWQAGVYRELLRVNGYHDYKIRYHYLTVTKENEPRIDVFEIHDDAMDAGFEAFSEWLEKANDYITGKIEAPLLQDGSKYANQQTHQHPLKHDTHVEQASGDDVIDILE